jgi:MoxR-like ATPase
MVKNVQEPVERVAANVERVIVGKHAEVRMALVSLLCEGHILIEDVPGVGKTMLAKARPAAVGRDRSLDLQPEDAGVRVSPGADHGPDRPGR